MEVLDFVKLGLQAIGTGIAVILFFKREMDSFKKELRDSMEKNSRDIRALEKEFYSYKEKALEKFVRREDFEKIFVSIEGLKALILNHLKEGKNNGKTT